MGTDSQSGWTANLPERFTDWLDNRQIDDVECIIADLAGISRGKAMPAKKFGRGENMHLPISIFYQTITGDYAEIDGIENQWTESDIILTPDISTATAVPWSGDVTMQVIHDAFDRSGQPVPIAPRNVLKHVVSLYRDQGWRPVVAPELEFYLTKPNPDPDYPIEPPVGRTGRPGIGRQAYSMSAVDEYGQVIDDIYDFAEAQGFEIDTIIQEGGAGQIEINLQHGDPVALADEVFYYKRLIREAALRNNCYATFMAKPMENQPGSAMHVHQSIVRAADDSNLFNNADDEPSDEFFHFLGGLQTYLPSVFSIIAPYVNSYRRFIADEAAPINLEWGHDNRTTGFRVPLSAADARRIENRVIGMDCNPYLAIAASLACGYLGMTQKLSARPSMGGEAYSLPHALPRGLLESLDLLEESGAISNVLGEDFCTVYKCIKRFEIEAFLQAISPWERHHLLLNV